ncbi:MAG: hypothetical protein ACJ8ER_11995 [Allosphingosinicella sp.]
MEDCYVRIWNAAGNRVFGWLGNSDGYAACVPAGLYSSPLTTPGAVIAQWQPTGNPMEGKVLLKDSNLAIGGVGSGGVSAYWHPVGDAYPLQFGARPNLKLDSPVPGVSSGTLAHVRDGKPFALHAWYTKNNDVFGFNFLETAQSLGEIFSGNDVKLEFETDKLVFEFVPASRFSRDVENYVPDRRARYDFEQLGLSSWMGDLEGYIGKRALADLVIPGSHDAASTGFEIFDGNRRSQTQFRDIYHQLTQGARYLDLRFTPYYDSTWYGAHGSDTSNLEITQALKDINRFLDENPREILIISLLPIRNSLVPGTDLTGLWDVVLNGLAPRIFPRFFTQSKDGSSKEYQHFIKNASISALADRRQNILLFSWGRPPTGRVQAQGAMAGERRDYHVWPATPENPTVTPGPKPWQAAFKAAEAADYPLAFDLAGVWINSYSTTAHDIRLVLDAVEPPPGKTLWAMHVNAPASGGAGDESIYDKALRIQPPFSKLLHEDWSMTAKANIVNLDFVGDFTSAGWLIELNLRR